MELPEVAAIDEQAQYDACIDKLLRRYERNGTPGKGLYPDDLDESIFVEVSRVLGLTLKSWRAVDVDSSGSILQDQVAAKHQQGTNRIIGFRSFEITGTLPAAHAHGETKGDAEKKFTVVLKSKISMHNITQIAAKMAAMLDPQLGEVCMEYQQSQLPVSAMLQMLEIRVAQVSMWHPAFKPLLPDVFLTRAEPETDQYYFIMEKMEAAKVSHMDAMLRPGEDRWRSEDINTVLKDIANFHAAFFDRIDYAKSLFGCVLRDLRQRFSSFPQLPNMVMKAGIAKFPELLTPPRACVGLKLTESIPTILKKMEDFKNTLSHGDFTPRNVCLRRKPGSGRATTCAYDWEFLSIHMPQHDVVDFLIFVLDPESDMSVWFDHIEFYRKQLQRALCGRNQELIDDATDSDKFMQGIELCLMEYIANRLTFHLIIRVAKGAMPHTEAIYANAFRFMEPLNAKYDFLK